MRTCAPSTSGPEGFTLIEMLVVLTVLGLAAAAMASRLSAEPARFAGERQLAALERAVGVARNEAAQSGRAVALDPQDVIPAGTVGAAVFGDRRTLLFYPDGSSSGGTIEIAGRTAITVDWLTGATRRAD